MTATPPRKLPLLIVAAQCSGGESLWRSYPLSLLMAEPSDKKGAAQTRSALMDSLGADRSPLPLSSGRLAWRKHDGREALFLDLGTLKQSEPVAHELLSTLGAPAALVVASAPAVTFRAQADNPLRALSHATIRAHAEAIDLAGSRRSLRAAAAGPELPALLEALREAATQAWRKDHSARAAHSRRDHLLTYGSLNKPTTKAPVLALFLKGNHLASPDGSRSNARREQSYSLLLAALPLPEGSSWEDLTPRDEAGALALLDLAKRELRARQARALAQGHGSLIQREDWISGLSATCAGGRWMIQGRAETVETPTKLPRSTVGLQGDLGAELDALCGLAGDAIDGLPRARGSLLSVASHSDELSHCAAALTLIESERSAIHLPSKMGGRALGQLLFPGAAAPLAALLDKIDMELAIGPALAPKRAPSL